MSCAVKDIIKLDIYIFNNNTLILHIRYLIAYNILKRTNNYHENTENNNDHENRENKNDRENTENNNDHNNT